MVSQLGGMDDTLCDKIVNKIGFDLFFSIFEKLFYFSKRIFKFQDPMIYFLDGKLLSKHKENYTLISTCHCIRKFLC